MSVSHISGVFPEEAHCNISLVNYVNSDNNKDCDFSIVYFDENREETHKMGGKIIDHSELNLKQTEFFPHGKLRFLIKVVTTFDSDHSELSRAESLLSKIYDDMKNTDVKFKTKDDKEISAHKIVLRASSDVFEAMFAHDGTTEKQTGIIEATDLSSEIVESLLHFIYCENFSTAEVDENEINIFNAAEKYNLKELKTICLSSIYDRIDIDNVLEFVEFAELFNLKELYSCCLLIIFA